MIQRLAIVALGVSCLLFAEGRERVQISKTEHVDFQAGGVLRLKNSTGELAIEGWDRTSVEITTVKSTKREYSPQEREKAMQKLDRVHVASQRNGDELLITTDFPGRASDFYLDYRIKVPMSTRLVADHSGGEVHVENLTSDIEVALHQGEITLDLPEEGRYTINAKSDCGSIVSDFPGQEKRRFWFTGHTIEYDDSQAAHKLNLRVGYGDVIILKTHIPKMPLPLSVAPKRDGA